MSPFRWTLVLVAASLAAPGCAVDSSQKTAGATSSWKVTSVDVSGGKQTVLLITSVVDGGLGFTRPPQDVNGSWAIEVTVGVYGDENPAIASSTPVFGLESDLRGATQTPTQFYGVYCRHFLTPAVGIQVFASSHGGNHGQVFFDDARVIDLRIETDGATVTYKARDNAAGGAYTTVGTRSLASPGAAHNPGFGFFNGVKGGSYGFTNFRIPSNGGPLVPPPDQQVALNSCYDAARAALEAGYALDGPVVGDSEVAAAKAALGTADGLLGAARTLIAALPAAKPPRDVALKALDSAAREVDKAAAALDKKGAKAAKPVLKSIGKKMYGAIHKVTEMLITPELRASLPGGDL